VLLGIVLMADEELLLLDPLLSIVPPNCAPPDAPTSPASGFAWAWAAPVHASTAQTPTIDRFQECFVSITASVRPGFSARSPMQGRGILHPERRAVRPRLYTAWWVSQRVAAEFPAPYLTMRSGSVTP